jgi:hypothetical protein
VKAGGGGTAATSSGPGRELFCFFIFWKTRCRVS